MRFGLLKNGIYEITVCGKIYYEVYLFGEYAEMFASYQNAERFYYLNN